VNAARYDPFMSATIKVYTKQNCPFCIRAKRLLEKKGVAYEEIDVEGNDDLRIWLADTTGQKTVPQIFAGDRSLGGFTDLDALDRDGKLDPILRGEG
jgi:glutaredoxin 3